MKQSYLTEFANKVKDICESNNFDGDELPTTLLAYSLIEQDYTVIKNYIQKGYAKPERPLKSVYGWYKEQTKYI